MKNPYTKKGPKRVHPSPPTPSLLSILPAALLALASALSAEEQEVLAYLLGSEKPPKDLDNSNSKKQNKKHSYEKKQQQQQLINNHPPDLGCSCFGCYKSFWARWDASPNRHAIHLIIDAFEEKEAINLKTTTSSSRKKRSSRKRTDDADDIMVNNTYQEEIMNEAADDQKLADDDDDDDAHAHDDGYDGYEDDEIDVDEEGKSTVRRFVSWVFGINN